MVQKTAVPMSMCCLLFFGLSQATTPNDQQDICDVSTSLSSCDNGSALIQKQTQIREISSLIDEGETSNDPWFNRAMRIASAGHRGIAPGAYENSVRSVLMCHLVNCSGFEMDVKVSQDGVGFSLHENALDRVSDIRDRNDEWASASGSMGTLNIQSYDAADIDQLRMPGTFPPERIPRAIEVFREAVKYNLVVVIHNKAGPSAVLPTAREIMTIPNANPSNFIFYGSGSSFWAEYANVAAQVNPNFLASSLDDTMTYVPVGSTGNARRWRGGQGKAVDMYILDTALDIDNAAKKMEVGIRNANGGTSGGWQELRDATLLIETNRPGTVECMKRVIGTSRGSFLLNSGSRPTCDTVPGSCGLNQQVYAQWNSRGWYRATISVVDNDNGQVTVTWHDGDTSNRVVPFNQVISEQSSGCPSGPDYRQYIQVRNHNSCNGAASVQCPGTLRDSECLTFCQMKCDEMSGCRFANFDSSTKACRLSQNCTSGPQTTANQTLMQTATCAEGFRVLAPCPEGTQCRYDYPNGKDKSTGSTTCGQICSGRIVMFHDDDRIRVFFDNARVADYAPNQVRPCPISECHGYGAGVPSGHTYEWGTEADRGSGGFSLGRNNCIQSCQDLHAPLSR